MSLLKLPLHRADMNPDPLKRFDSWFCEADAAGIKEPRAMTLATVDPDNKPSARIVLLKNYGPNGFTFFTHYESRKGRTLFRHNPYAALVFWWEPLRRQVRVEGIARKLSPEHSDEYFQTRPRGHQLEAIASIQSQRLTSYKTLEERYKDLERMYEGKKIDRPKYWGGIVIDPERFEFWQERPNRLHNRFEYRKSNNDKWTINRLYP